MTVEAFRQQPDLTVPLVQEVSDILDKPQTFTTRLNNCLKAVAEALNAEIGAIYLFDDSLHLEPCIKYDKTKAQHYLSRFKVGEGLIGYIAATGQSISTSNLTSHPSFVYRPGVANYSHLALIGVPIYSEKGTVGVMTLQNPLCSPFETWQLDTLQSISKELGDIAEFKLLPSVPFKSIDDKPNQKIQGVGFCGGVGVGQAFYHKPMVFREASGTKDIRAERARLKDAIRELIADIDRKLDRPEISDQDISREVLEAHRMIAQDRVWIKQIQEGINRGLTSEAAVQKVRRETRERFAQMGDKYLKARAADLEDLAIRLLRFLSGDSCADVGLQEPTILIAHHMGPAELLDYDRRYVKGLVLEEGVHTAHVAIVARALDIPVIGRVASGVALINEGTKVIIDGSTGEIILNPTPGRLADTRKKIQAQKRWQEGAKELRDVPAVTQDGVAIDLMINAGLVLDLEHLQLLNAKGVGLYRTEIPFMMRSSFPSLQVQTDVYKDVFERVGDKPVTFRTLDIGGDKVVPYMWQSADENPAMGWRAVRVALDRPALLKQQVRALLRASQGGDIRILFPMVSVADEFLKARKLVEQELERAKTNKEVLPASISYGLMLEVPSMAWDLDRILPQLDFVAIGTNDLFQFFYASDRTNPQVALRYDSLSAAFLTFLGEIHAKCTKAGVPVSICGEMASRPIEALALLGLGYTKLSLTPPAFVAIKKLVIHLDLAQLQTAVKKWLEEGKESLREELSKFAAEHKLLDL